MYNPVDMLLNKNASRDGIKATFSAAVEGINAIADILYCADLTEIDKCTHNGLGVALLVLNGVVNASVEKMEMLNNE